MDADWDGYLFETAQPRRHGTSEHHARAKLLQAAFVALGVREGATQLVLETRSDGGSFATLDQKDHQALHQLQRATRVPRNLQIRHSTKDEPVLAIADLLAGARADLLCAVSDEPYALVGHRIRSIEPVQVA